ncbi:MAG: flagellar biosynthesis regulator FlaF [Rhodobacteraceae bacterium]|nr:flagellar biosynthesis regulator FlaF [Paracoccaceae bacterium]
MNAQLLAETAYSGLSAPARSARSIEYAVFARITRALAAAGADEAGPAARGGTQGGRARARDFAGFPALAAAIHDNLRLWAVIAADVAEPGNRLPEALRARLFYLAEFTRAHSRAVLAGKAGTAALVEINTAVMRGLRGEGPAAPAPPQARVDPAGAARGL